MGIESDLYVFEKSANKRGILWGICEEDFVNQWNIQEGRCSLSGLPLMLKPRSWSIDRIDNEGDYTPDNIQIVDKRVNMMKGQLHNYVFVDLCRRIASRNEV